MAATRCSPEVKYRKMYRNQHCCNQKENEKVYHFFPLLSKNIFFKLLSYQIHRKGFLKYMDWHPKYKQHVGLF